MWGRVSRKLFQALSEIHRFDDLEDLLDFVCESIVAMGEWNTAFLSFYLGDEAAYGAAGCEAGMKERFHRSFLRTKPERREARRRQILQFAWEDSSICFLPEGSGPRPSPAFVPSPDLEGNWLSGDRLMIFMRDHLGGIIGVLSLDNPIGGNRPDDSTLGGLVEVEHFCCLIGELAENRFWSIRLERAGLRFERAAACGRNWIWEVDLAGRLLYSSPALEDILGLGPEYVIGRPIAELVVPADRKALEFWLNQPVHSTNLVTRFLHGDGREVTIDSCGTRTPVSTDQPAAFLGSSRDISMQIRAERALKESEGAYRGIFESVTDALVILDLDGNIVEANPAACRMSGYHYEEILGLSGYAIIHPESYEVYEALKREVRSGGRLQTDAKGVRRDGSALAVNVYGTGFEYRGKHHILAVIRDITERKKVFDRLLQQEKDESIATLAGGVAHDFNNYLVGILGSIELLGPGLADDDDKAALGRQISDSAQRLQGLTQQLLAYAQGGKYRPRAISARRVLEETVTLTRGMRRSRIQVEVGATDDLWPVEADLTQFQQVFMNLVLNAYDAMEDDGILRIEMANERRMSDWVCPQTGSRSAGDYVWVRVSDTGVGMDEETKAHMFEPFFTTKFHGRGLGLAAILGIVRNHGGSIEVESEPGCGASFHLRFPRSMRKPAPVTTGKHGPADSEGRPFLALVVDDEEVVRQLARAMLGARGWSVCEAEDGPTALELYRERADEIDVVLLDVQMPGMCGAEVFEELKAIDADVRVVLTSGYDEKLAREGLDENSGVAGFLPKPYTLDELMRPLTEAIGKP
jgi:PAS domain S-box-containing protein